MSVKAGEKSQIDEFMQATRFSDADENQARLDERPKEIAKAMPAPEKPT